MKLKIVLIEEESKKDEQLMPIGLTEEALGIQMGLLLNDLKALGFIEKYETAKDKTNEICIYPKKLEYFEYVARTIADHISLRNMEVERIKEERRARLAELKK